MVRITVRARRRVLPGEVGVRVKVSVRVRLTQFPQPNSTTLKRGGREVRLEPTKGFKALG